jgi:hypothetical protein
LNKGYFIAQMIAGLQILSSGFSGGFSGSVQGQNIDGKNKEYPNILEATTS